MSSVTHEIIPNNSAPASFKRLFKSTITWKGDTYVQIASGVSNNWVESSLTSLDIEAVLDNGELTRAGQRILGEGGGYMDLRAGITWYFDAAGTGAPLTGFWYSLIGDYTFYFQTGGVVTIDGGVNDGTHKLTTVLYDGVNTYVQWVNMTPDFVNPELVQVQQSTDGNVKFGNDSSYHYAASFGPGFGYAGITSSSAKSVFGDWFSFFGYTYIWEYDLSAPLKVDQRRGGYNIFNNKYGDGIVTLGDIDSFPSASSNSQAIARQNVINSFAGGGKYVTMKTNNACYSNRFIIHKGAPTTPNETVIEATTPTADRTVTLPDADMDFDAAISETLNFPGVASGEVLTMTFTNGILTARTLVP